MNQSLGKTNYHIVHTSPGRIRISVPQLNNDWEYANKLEQLLNSLDFVVRVRLNPSAYSIAIRYDVSAISDQTFMEQIATCFQQAVVTNINQHNQNFTKASDTKADSEALASTRSSENLAGKIGGEVVGGIVGGFIGQLLLGPIGERIASELMGRAGGLIGESVSKEIADVVGLLQHLECQATKKMKPVTHRVDQLQKNQFDQPQVTGLTASQLANLWQTNSSTISAQADNGVMAFECWTQEQFSIRWTFLLCDPANPKSEKLFFPCGGIEKETPATSCPPPESSLLVKDFLRRRSWHELYQPSPAFAEQILGNATFGRKTIHNQ